VINYILCSQSPHNSTDHVLTKCRCCKRSESNCDSSQNNIYHFCYRNMFLEFLITPHCAHSHLTTLLVGHSTNAGAMRGMSQIMTHHKVTTILFLWECVLKVPKHGLIAYFHYKCSSSMENTSASSKTQGPVWLTFHCYDQSTLCKCDQSSLMERDLT
jgi:hypothetical protein